MQAALRPYAVAGAALIGASAIAVNTSTLNQHQTPEVQRVSDAAVRLASGGTDVLADLTLQDIENVPYNFLASIANIPYYEFADPISTADIASGGIAYTLTDPGVTTTMPETSLGAVGLLDNVLAYEGDFFLLDSVNVLGIDPADPGKIAAFADILSANPDIGSAVAGQLIPILEAELPLQAGCTAASAGGCPDPLEILMGSNQSTGFEGVTTNLEVPGYFSVPIQDFFSADGYTFPGTESDPLLNPVPSGEPVPPGIPVTTPTDPIPPTADGATGYETLPWSGETVNFNDIPNASSAYLQYLTQDPSGNPIELPTLQDVTTDLSNLVTGTYNTLNPFVPGTYCLICAPFVPGDTDLQGFLQEEYNEAVGNFQTTFATAETDLETEFADFESLLANPAGFFDSLLAESQSNFAATIATFDTEIEQLIASLQGDLGSALPGAATDLTGTLDLGALTADLTTLVNNSGLEALASIAPDAVSFIPF